MTTSHTGRRRLVAQLGPTAKPTIYLPVREVTQSCCLSAR
jgi:hypothetical protein